MKSRDFCYWLQGFFELGGKATVALDPEQVTAIKNHLSLVFRHEIDPSAGSAAHQEELTELHSRPSGLNPDILIRC